MIARRRRKSKGDPIVALINIVFLILIFFMVTGTLARAPDSSIDFVSGEDAECCASPDVLAISAQGVLMRNGATYGSPRQYLAENPPESGRVRVLPDRNLPAQELLSIMQVLRSGARGDASTQIVLLLENKQ